MCTFIKELECCVVSSVPSWRYSTLTFVSKIFCYTYFYVDKHFWTQGFQMKQSKESVPLFLDELAEQIFACGKAINLLKLTNIKVDVYYAKILIFLIFLISLDVPHLTYKHGAQD